MEFTGRVLSAMRCDMANLLETAERIRVQYSALAREHGVALPAVECPSDF
jgi:hypothetical protein